MIDRNLTNKYNIPVPRYTSYPTVPNWKENINVSEWKSIFLKQFKKANAEEGISLYIHLPFCESLCTYCGCNKKITSNHKVENEYLAALNTEWNMYLSLMKEKPVIREIHLGGGTPTFFSPENLSSFIKTILSQAIVHEDHNFSLEGHPNNTTREHLEALYTLGFRRVSYGVQDNDPAVQQIINRIQPFENVKRATELAREIGYDSVNFDLIYGLPLQTVESIHKTINQSISLKPDRVAFYSYAHVPWTSRGQRLFDETDLPNAEQKLNLYLEGKKLFLENGYEDLGMDHFSLPADSLLKASKAGKLHRNFMGYTTEQTGLMLGLGVSSISDSGNAFVQNSKSIHDYYEHIGNNEIPVEKGYFLSAEDESFKHYILDMSCRGSTQFRKEDLDLLQTYTFPELQLLAEDGMVTYDRTQARVTDLGRHFIRNICRAFDLYILRAKDAVQKNSFSKAI